MKRRDERLGGAQGRCEAAQAPRIRRILGLERLRTTVNTGILDNNTGIVYTVVGG